MPPSVPPPGPAAGRIAGIDFGRVRIGIAISDPQRTLASPYENYTRRGPEGDTRRFRRLVAEEGVVLFVVGLPVHLDGQESQVSHEARRFGLWLAEITGVPVEYFDERFSTSEAHELLKDAGMKHRHRKRRLDMLAAQVMLGAYLESRCKGRQPPGPLD
jgi:putative holliday junction resolvase